MPYDDFSWEESEDVESAWLRAILNEPTMRAIGEFMIRYREGNPTEMCDPKTGAFNIIFRMKYEDGGSIVIRFPKPGCSMFPEEKIRNEVAAMRYIRSHTSIPVPRVLHWGTREESPLRLGPFIIMDYIDHHTDASKVLNTPGLSWQDRPRLNPHISLDTLEMLYRQLADILLQLSKLEFPEIGSLAEVTAANWEVRHRPLSLHINELVRLGTLPRRKIANSTYATSPEYLEALAQLHADHLEHQRNDSVESEPDCRRKYVARRLFSKLVKERRPPLPPPPSGPFRLWCDDFRPTNVLLDADLQIVGVVDWEFTYAAPAEFSFAPPWWLLIEMPEYWPDGLAGWKKTYESRLETFLKAMRDAEDSAIAARTLRQDQRLSPKMRASWDSGEFWLMYAARKSFAFDAIFWQELNPRFLGPAAGDVLPPPPPEHAWLASVGDMDHEEKAVMEDFVERKIQSLETMVLAWDAVEEDFPLAESMVGR